MSSSGWLLANLSDAFGRAMKHIRLAAVLVVALLLPSARASASPITLSFTALDARNIMLAQGAPLHDAVYQWGLWALRVSPIVTGGGYDILGGSVTGIPGNWWNFAELSGVAAFQSLPGSEHYGVAAHPLYLVADQPANTFQSYSFDNTVETSPGRSLWTGVCTPGGDPTGCNYVNTVPDNTLFSFDFNLDPGAIWTGWRFLVDGSIYYQPATVPGGYGPSRWVADFVGGDYDLDSNIFGPGTRGGGLATNTGLGFQAPLPTPEPATLSLLAIGIAAVAARRFRRK